jgi:hypothetical protein
VAHGADAGLQSPCSPELLNHSVLRWVTATCLPYISSAFNGACCMPCEHAEQPLSHSVLEDTHVRAPMEIMMAWSLGGICLFALLPAELVLMTRDSSGAAMRQMMGARAQCHVAVPELPQARRGELESRGHGAAPELS